MAILEGTQVMLGLQPSYFMTKFEPQTGTTVRPGDTNGGEAGGGFEPVVSGFFTYTRPSGFSLGVALVPGMSQTLEFEENFVGRYFVQRSSLRTVALNPVVAFKTDSWVSFGLGVNIVFGALDKTSAVNNVLDADAPDGQIRYEQEGTGYGANVGILLEPENGSRIGLTYRSPVTIGFGSGTSVSGIGSNLAAVLDSLGVVGSTLSADVTVPQDLLLSLWQPIGEHAFVFSAGWQQWEELGQTTLTLADTASTTVTRTRFLQDTWHIAGGVHYRLSEPLMLMGGYAFDTSASSDEKRKLDLPVDAQHRIAGGVQWSANEKTTLSAAYLFAHHGSAPVREQGVITGTVVGEFSSHYAHFLSLSLNRAW
jgi:long-chain fatty acid transport protein